MLFGFFEQQKSLKIFAKATRKTTFTHEIWYADGSCCNILHKHTPTHIARITHFHKISLRYILIYKYSLQVAYGRQRVARGERREEQVACLGYFWCVKCTHIFTCTSICYRHICAYVCSYLYIEKYPVRIHIVHKYVRMYVCIKII